MCKFVFGVVLALGAFLTIDRLLFHPHRVLHAEQAKWRVPVGTPDEPGTMDATLIVAEGEAEWPV